MKKSKPKKRGLFQKLTLEAQRNIILHYIALAGSRKEAGAVLGITTESIRRKIGAKR